MQDHPLNLAQALEHAARSCGRVEVVTRRVEDGRIQRSNYAATLRRTKQFAHALRRLGVRPGDRVGTLAWNTHRHLEAWYAIAGQGGICHTINPRLFEPQIEYIINHAEDSVLCLDLTFVPLLERLQERLPSVREFVLFTDREHFPRTTLRNAHCYESLIAGEPEQFEWPALDESTPSSLCYTSGTTGNPKGVLYTHRSNVLHALAINAKGALGVAASDVVLLMVPMYHANSWGLGYACPMAGAKLVLPGCRLDPRNTYELLDGERVTWSAGVPTLWNNLLTYLREEQLSVPLLRELHVGGSAVSRSLIEAYDREFGVAVCQGWGMTEMSPLGSISRPPSHLPSLTYAEQLDWRTRQGRPLFGVSMKIVDDQGRELPHDGRSCGRLLVKGPWVVQRYYKEDRDAVDAGGWFDTGDIATIDEHGSMQITDRAKDVIKSGGEWISSVALENAALGHPQVALAAVIGVPHPRWEERPLLIVQPAPGATPCRDDLLTFLRDKVAKWWLPDDVVFVEEIPLTAAGKVSKRLLRERFREYRP